LTLAFPTPHLEKINKAIANEKMPADDAAALEKARDKYSEWIKRLDGVSGSPEARVKQLVELYNEYRAWVDVDLIFDSERDFLYRQKGQLKLDNSVLEEFLPRLVTPDIIPELKGLDVHLGPVYSFASAYFMSSLASEEAGGGLSIRGKDQDFAISRPLHIRASHTKAFGEFTEVETSLAYVAAECKTNLDKTMFQEATATARDVKAAVTGAKYFVICEWLDMTPLSTAATDIDEVLILRGKRLGSNVRKHFDTHAKRKVKRDEYTGYLKANPARLEVFSRFIDHIRRIFVNDLPVEKDVLDRGYF
jgi:hypothetical protein